MQVAAMLLGILGGVFGILTALVLLSVGGIASAMQVANAGYIPTAALVAIASCHVGFLGAGLTMGMPRLGAVLMTIAALGFVVATSYLAIVTAPMFFIAAIIAALAEPEPKRRVVRPIPAPPSV